MIFYQYDRKGGIWKHLLLFVISLKSSTLSHLISVETSNYFVFLLEK